MRSSQYTDSLNYLAHGNFSIASTKFKIMLASTHQKDSVMKANLLYFHAVSSLGDLLKKIVKESKELKAAPTKSDSSPTKQSLLDKIIKVINQTSSHFKEEKKDTLTTSQQSNIEKTTQQLQALQILFETAKNATKPTIMQGIDYAINNFIKNLLVINQSDYALRSNLFAKELIKFQLLYLTKLYVSEELEDQENKYLFNFLIPKEIKKMRAIFNLTQSDPLFLSYSQIDQLYNLQQTHQNHKKYDGLFQSLEECLWLSHSSYNNKEYIKILKCYKGSFKIDNIITLHDIYNDYHLTDLRNIIKKLHDDRLLNDKIIKCFANLITPSNNFRHHLNILVETIATSHSDEKNKLLIDLFSFGLNKIPYDKFTEYQFNKYISYVKTNCLSEDTLIDIKKINIYLDLLDFFINSHEDVLLFQVCDLMKETKVAIGSENVVLLCEKILTYKMSYGNFISLLNLGLQFRKNSAKDFLNLIDSHHADFHALKDKINDILTKDHQVKFPERSLESVIHDFLTKSNDVEFPIDEDELKQIEERYIKIQKMGDKLIKIGRAELQLKLKQYISILTRDPENEKAKLALLAIIRIHVNDKLGIYPYNVQMLNVLALLNQPKRIGQIKTGEGKSTLIAMLSAYFALQNRKVDIITTSHDLAIRDVEKYESFYRSLGLSIGQNVKKEHNDNWHENAIVYGTVSDFEFAYLRGETQDSSDGRGERPYDVVIADEVDSMFIDMQRNEAVLSSPNENAYDAEIYEDIWDWINQTGPEDQTSEKLQAMLKSKGTEVSLELATTWLKSACTARRYTEEKEYIIDYPETKSINQDNNLDRIIKIVNKAHTGEIAGDTTRWQGGLHELLEVKHNLKVRVESLTIASINHIEYFNKYKTLIGLTGTLGSLASRKELLQLYKVSTYDSPPYKLSIKKEFTHMIEKNESAQMDAIIKVVKQQIDAGRPVLLLCESIQDSKKFNKELAKHIKSTQVYNGVQSLSADAILGLAGNPGMVTIATNLAGRGADIITTPDAESHGGLHVIMTFPAYNQRVEQQAFGRTGRQGKHGTYQYILCENQLSDSEIKGETIEEKISLIRTHREIRQKMISSDNVYNYNMMHKIFILQTLFFALPMKIKSNYMTEWAILKTDINKYALQYMHNELDLNEDSVMLNIIDKFNEFWKTNLSKNGDIYKTPIDFVKSSYNQSINDEYTKKMLLAGIVFFENSKIDFSMEESDLLLELRALEWQFDENTPQTKSNVMPLYKTNYQIKKTTTSDVKETINLTQPISNSLK